MERRVTARKVAELAGVSVSAVSRTFTEGASVSRKTRERILAAAQSIGYHPNLLARSLMTGRTELIGLVSNNFDNPAFMEIFNLFTRGLQPHGLRPLLINLSGGEDTKSALATLQQYNVDAVIVASSTLPSDFIAGCIELRLPVVHAFGRTEARTPVHVVGANNREGGRLAATILAERFYRKIAFLGGPQGASSTQDRLDGFHEGLKAHDLDLALAVYGPSYAHEVGMELMSQILKSGVVDAVFCGDDILAIGAMDACRKAGINIPEALGIVGFNDIAMASWPSYRLTTIRQPIADIIIAAVEDAIRLVSDPSLELTPKLFPCTPILRDTVRRL